jgi:aryl-alcohol dehydrogenase-like predicted oxidoreductase
MTTLGRTGLTVSNLCLGSMQFGWTADERSSFDVMDAFVAAGGNFIDTADIYSRWHPGAVALAWELTRPAIQSPIIGANTPDQLADLCLLAICNSPPPRSPRSTP